MGSHRFFSEAEEVQIEGVMASLAPPCCHYADVEDCNFITLDGIYSVDQLRRLVAVLDTIVRERQERMPYVDEQEKRPYAAE